MLEHHSKNAKRKSFWLKGRGIVRTGRVAYLYHTSKFSKTKVWQKQNVHTFVCDNCHQNCTAHIL